VHRNLATRNVLLTSEFTTKICDFGMAVFLGHSDRTVDRNTESFPVRWTAVEALLHGEFTLKSDVWCFGVLLHEVYSLGEPPYRGWTNVYVTERVCEGYRMPKPDRCPRRVFTSVVQPALANEPGDRPDFHTILELLQQQARMESPDEPLRTSTRPVDSAGGSHPGSAVRPPRPTPLAIAKAPTDISNGGQSNYCHSVAGAGSATSVRAPPQVAVSDTSEPRPLSNALFRPTTFVRTPPRRKEYDQSDSRVLPRSQASGCASSHAATVSRHDLIAEPESSLFRPQPSWSCETASEDEDPSSRHATASSQRASPMFPPVDDFTKASLDMFGLSVAAWGAFAAPPRTVDKNLANPRLRRVEGDGPCKRDDVSNETLAIIGRPPRDNMRLLLPTAGGSVHTDGPRGAQAGPTDMWATTDFTVTRAANTIPLEEDESEVSIDLDGTNPRGFAEHVL
jgi:hypothetical protein